MNQNDADQNSHARKRIPVRTSLVRVLESIVFVERKHTKKDTKHDCASWLQVRAFLVSIKGKN